MSKDRFQNMKTTIIAVLWAVHPFEHIGKEIAQIERDSMDIDVLANTGSKTTMLVTLMPSDLPKGTNEQQVCDTTVIVVIRWLCVEARVGRLCKFGARANFA